jgi:hypothetical protein
MAIKWPLANGNWSNAANWNDGTLPAIDDDVYADGKTVTIDQDVTVLSIRNTERLGGINGGLFQITSGSWTITADLIGTSLITNTLLLVNSISGVTVVNGNLSTGIGTGVGIVIDISENRICYVNGNISTGATFKTGVQVRNGATLYFLGNITTSVGNSISSHSQFGINITPLANLFGFGNVTGNSGLSHGIRVGGTAVGSLGTIYFNGNGFSDSCRNDTTSNQCILKRAVGTEQYGSGITGRSTITFFLIEEIEYGPNGESPTSGPVKFVNDIIIKSTITRRNNSNTTLIDLNNIPNELPLISDVRLGIMYNTGQKTGTMAVPVASNVRKDVPVDDTVGTADLTAEDILNAILTSENPVAERLRNVSTVQTTGDQIAGS